APARWRREAGPVAPEAGPVAPETGAAAPKAAWRRPKAAWRRRKRVQRRPETGVAAAGAARHGAKKGAGRRVLTWQRGGQSFSHRGAGPGPAARKYYIPVSRRAHPADRRIRPS